MTGSVLPKANANPFGNRHPWDIVEDNSWSSLFFSPLFWFMFGINIPHPYGAKLLKPSRFPSKLEQCLTPKFTSNQALASFKLGLLQGQLEEYLASCLRFGEKR